MTCAERFESFSISVFHWYFHGSRRYHQNSLNPLALPQEFGCGERLDCLSQTHVVGQNYAATAGRKDGSAHLVWEEFGFQDPGQGVLAAGELGQELAFELQALRNLILPLDILEHITVDDSLIVGLPDGVQHLGETSKCSRRNSPSESKYSLAKRRKPGEGESGKRRRTSIVSPYCKEMEARARAYFFLSNALPCRSRSWSNKASICLQVPKVLTAKSGQEQ
jgi:hypothetical protein